MALVVACWTDRLRRLRRLRRPSGRATLQRKKLGPDGSLLVHESTHAAGGPVQLAPERALLLLERVESVGQLSLRSRRRSSRLAARARSPGGGGRRGSLCARLRPHGADPLQLLTPPAVQVDNGGDRVDAGAAPAL